MLTDMPRSEFDRRMAALEEEITEKTCKYYALRENAQRERRRSGVEAGIATITSSVSRSLGNAIRAALIRPRKKEVYESVTWYDEKTQIWEELRLLHKKRVDMQIEQIAEGKEGEIDLLLNPFLEEEGKAEPFFAIQDIKEKLIEALKQQKPQKNKIKLKSIRFNHCGCTPPLLKELIHEGIGLFHTETLDLSYNELGEHMILFLRDVIVYEGSAFQNLKHLYLSGNKLGQLSGSKMQFPCLFAIQQIVQHVQLERIALSDNPLLGGQFSEEQDFHTLFSIRPLRNFLHAMLTTMPSLKHVELRNVGLRRTFPTFLSFLQEKYQYTEEERKEVTRFVKRSLKANQVTALAGVLERSLFLEVLDIRENTFLEKADFLVLLDRLKKNLSLKKLLFSGEDGAEALEWEEKAKKILLHHQALIAGLEGDPSQPILIQILEARRSGKELPPSLASFLEEGFFQRSRIERIVQEICRSREVRGVLNQGVLRYNEVVTYLQEGAVLLSLNPAPSYTPSREAGSEEEGQSGHHTFKQKVLARSALFKMW